MSFLSAILSDIVEYRKAVASLRSTSVLGESYGNIFSGYGTTSPRAFGDPDEQTKAYNGWVYKAVHRKSTDVCAELPEAEIQKDDETHICLPPTHPLSLLLSEPNPFEAGGLFWQRYHIFKMLCGNVFVLLIPSALNGGLIVEMYILHPAQMTIVVDKTQIIKCFRYRVGGRNIDIPPRYIIHDKYPNPNDFFLGWSPLQACAYEVDIDTEAKKHQLHFLKNHPQVRIVIEQTGNINPNQDKEFRELLKSQQVSTDDDGRPWFMPENRSAKALALSATEINYLATRENAMSDILSIYNVPPSIMGLNKNSNRANSESDERTYARFSVEPEARLRDKILTVQLAEMVRCYHHHHA